MTLDNEKEHALKNHMAIILGYCELLMGDTPSDDPRYGDILEMHRAATAVLALVTQAPSQ